MSSLAREVFDQFVEPYYQTEGVAGSPLRSCRGPSQRHKSGHITLVAEDSGELVGMLHLREPRHVSMLFVQSSRQRGDMAPWAARRCGCSSWRYGLRVHCQFLTECRFCLRAFRFSYHWLGAVRSRHSLCAHATSLAQ